MTIWMRKILSMLLAFTLTFSWTLPALAKELSQETQVQTEATETVAEEEEVQEETIATEPEGEESSEETTAPAPEGEETVPEEPTEQETLPPEETEEPEAEEPEAPQREMPQFFQGDYPDARYGNGTIASDGDSVVSLAMVATYLTGHVYLPDELAAYFGDLICNNNMERLEYASNQLQLPWRKAENWHDALAEMRRGCVVIALMGQNSAFTNSQHYVVLTGLTEDEKVWVNDPLLSNYDQWNLKDGFQNGFPQGYITTGYAGSWIYDPSAMPANPFIYHPPEKPEVELRYPDITLTAAETDLLARMVWVEAQGEPIEGQQAVAEVVLNRLKSSRFPNTLKGVIYAENQFRSTAYLRDAKPNQAQYVAIERALEGPYVLDEGVVFFATYPVNDNVWGKIGGHTFCFEESKPEQE